MRFLTRIALLFYITIITTLGLAFLMFLANVIDINSVVEFYEWLYFDDYAALIAGLIAAIIILKSFAFARIIYGRQEKERTIAFNNPSGEVSISLTAIEDLIRRVIYKIPEVKEIRPAIRANKKGLDVQTRLVLNSDVNIPQLTARLQEMVKEKIEDAIGSGEKITIHTHVIKITSAQANTKSKKNSTSEEKQDSNVPFHGYRA